MMLKKDKLYNAIIVGGGLAGLALAIALGRATKGKDFSIALIEQSAQIEQTPTMSHSKALALNYQSFQHLKKWDVLDLLQFTPEPIRVVEVSHKNITHFKAEEVKTNALGYVCDAFDLKAAFEKTLEAFPNIHVFRPASVCALERIEDTSFEGWSLRLQNDITLLTPLLLALDGANSFIRHKLGIDAKHHDFNQEAIVMNIKTTISSEYSGWAFEHFLNEGSIAFLPLPMIRVHECFDTRWMKCVWVVPKESENSLFFANDLVNLPEELLINKIKSVMGQTLQQKLGNLLEIGHRMSFSLESVYAETLYCDRCVFIGNAATTVHPIAAAGFNLALRDIACFAKLVQSVLHEYKTDAFSDLGVTSFLKGYANRRINDHKNTRQFSDRLAKWPAVFIEGGIFASEYIWFLRKKILAQGMGMFV